MRVNKVLCVNNLESEKLLKQKNIERKCLEDGEKNRKHEKNGRVGERIEGRRKRIEGK